MERLGQKCWLIATHKGWAIIFLVWKKEYKNMIWYPGLTLGFLFPGDSLDYSNIFIIYIYIYMAIYIKTETAIIANHYDDVIMTTMAAQITSLTVVYSTVYWDANQRKHQSSASLAFVWEIHRDRWIPHTKGQLRGKCFHLMTSSCNSFPGPFWGACHHTNRQR